MVLVENNVTASGVTTRVYKIIDEVTHNLCTFLGFKNVHPGIIPPLTTWEQFAEITQTLGKTFDQKHLEGWFSSSSRFENDPLTRGTFSQYQQVHNVIISGFVWHSTMMESYRQAHEKGEALAQLLEKNKGMLHTSIDEFQNLRVDFDFR